MVDFSGEFEIGNASIENVLSLDWNQVAPILANQDLRAEVDRSVGGNRKKFGYFMSLLEAIAGWQDDGGDLSKFPIKITVEERLNDVQLNGVSLQIKGNENLRITFNQFCDGIGVKRTRGDAIFVPKMDGDEFALSMKGWGENEVRSFIAGFQYEVGEGKLAKNDAGFGVAYNKTVPEKNRRNLRHNRKAATHVS